jgi:phage shock protein PspC (stress-responsive transcriptional regulator)
MEENIPITKTNKAAILSLVTAIIPMLIFYVIAWIILPVEEPEKA